jgi:hypothetical protein
MQQSMGMESSPAQNGGESQLSPCADDGDVVVRGSARIKCYGECLP